jgi:hypothetical protein
MTTITEKILNDLAELPTEMQMEALDFVMSLKAKLAKNKVLDTETKPNGPVIAETLEKASKRNLFADIDDPVAWQREIRKDRPLPEREE